MSRQGARSIIRLSDAQRLEWLRLIRTDGVGPRTFRKLVNHFGGATEALAALPELARQRGVAPPRIPSVAEIEQEFEAAQRMGVRHLATGEADYPAALAAIDDAPPLLAVRGQASVLAGPAVAIVGSRNASALGQQMARALAADLGRAGFVVVSGLARGVDARAHEATVETGTVAALAGGHDRIYPPEHETLLAALVERGAAISEMPMGWEPRGRDFPRRNRLVSGLSLGVVLVEAARKSGSLITARFALEQGREVFAVPGSPLDPRSEGTNGLIRDGAVLVTRAEDIIAVLQPMIARSEVVGSMRELPLPDRDEPLFDEFDFLAEGDAHAPTLAPAPAAEVLAAHHSTPVPPDMATLVRELLGPTPVALDVLVRASGLHPRDVHLALHDLRAQGLPVRLAGAFVVLDATAP